MEVVGVHQAGRRDRELPGAARRRRAVGHGFTSRHEDGSEGEIGPGEAYVIEPGHDAWVVGDEAFVGFEFESPTAEVYAKG